jgi:hypothetical protein
MSAYISTYADIKIALGNPALKEIKFIWKKATLRTGRPLTIACHMKNAYFLTGVSFFTAGESTLTAGESALTTGESTFTTGESTLGESTLLSVLEELLHAAKAPIATTKKNFFIC